MTEVSGGDRFRGLYSLPPTKQLFPTESTQSEIPVEHPLSDSCCGPMETTFIGPLLPPRLDLTSLLTPKSLDRSPETISQTDRL